MRSTTVIFLITVAAAFGKEPTQEDYDIWAAIIVGSRKPLTGAAYVWHRVEPVSTFARGLDRGALDIYPQFRSVADAWSAEAAELDIDRLNAAILATEEPFPRPMQVLDDQMLEKIVGKKPKPAWIVSPQLLEGADSIWRF